MIGQQLTADEYQRAISLCRRVAYAVADDNGGPTVAGGFLAQLHTLLTPATTTPTDPAPAETGA